MCQVTHLIRDEETMIWRAQNAIFLITLLFLTAYNCVVTNIEKDLIDRNDLSIFLHAVIIVIYITKAKPVLDASISVQSTKRKR